MLKPLVINHSYLLENSSTGKIQRVFWEYNREHDFLPTIICSSSKHNSVHISTLNCKVLPTWDCQIIRYFVALLKRTVSPDYAFLPDYSYYSWAKVSAIRKAIKEAKSGQYDFVHSTSLTCSSHLIALKVKESSGLPWIASFYDPWYMHPYRTFKIKRFAERDRIYEENIAKKADAIIHTNQAIFNEWIERYGEDIKSKMFVLPLVFDPSRFSRRSDLQKVNNSKFIISHIGTLYPNRDSVDFLKSIRLLIDKHPELSNKFIVNYVGTVTDRDKYYVGKLGLNNNVNFVGFVSENECEDYYLKSDLFLSIDGKYARNIFFPSKIMKYFYYARPIVGLSPHNSALQYELNQSHNYCFSNEDYNGISDFLFHVITEKNFSEGIDKEYWKKFTMDSVYPDYLSIVRKVTYKY